MELPLIFAGETRMNLTVEKAKKPRESLSDDFSENQTVKQLTGIGALTSDFQMYILKPAESAELVNLIVNLI